MDHRLRFATSNSCQGCIYRKYAPRLWRGGYRKFSFGGKYEKEYEKRTKIWQKKEKKEERGKIKGKPKLKRWKCRRGKTIIKANRLLQRDCPVRTMVGFYIHKLICLLKTSDRPEIIRPENRFSLFYCQKMILKKLIEKICNGLVNFTFVWKCLTAGK